MSDTDFAYRRHLFRQLHSWDREMRWNRTHDSAIAVAMGALGAALFRRGYRWTSVPPFIVVPVAASGAIVAHGVSLVARAAVTGLEHEWTETGKRDLEQAVGALAGVTPSPNPQEPIRPEERAWVDAQERQAWIDQRDGWLSRLVARSVPSVPPLKCYWP